MSEDDLRKEFEIAYALGVAAERERAAKVCEELPVREPVRFAAANERGSHGHNAAELVLKLAAAAIRGNDG